MAKYRGRLELNWVNKGDIIISKIFPKEEKARPLSFQNGEFDEEELLPRELELIKTVKRKKLDPEPENMLIWGENLIALRSLEKDFAGKIKLIYIDPPFNTGQDFEHYEDGVEHSIWLSMMRDRIELLKNFLTEDGVIFVHIDDEEMAYLKVLIDEVFRRPNFITSLCVKMSHLSGVKMSHIKKRPPKLKEFILVYAKNKEKLEFNPVFEPATWWDVFDRYKSFLIKDKNNPQDITKWKVIPLRKAVVLAGININNEREFERFCLKNASNIFRTARNRSDLFMRLPRDNRFRFVNTPTGLKKLAYKREEVLFASEKLKKGNPISFSGDIWLDIGINNLHNEGGVSLRFGKKPEKLLYKIIEMSTKKNDWVLDCFAGSGTTGAVAHKLGRKWIIIELNKQAKTLCFERLKNVINGKDQSGISKEIEWKGGGGFKFYKLGEPLIVKHKDYPSIKIINPKYYNGALIKVICKLEGFIFKDDPIMHGVNKLGNKYAHITEQYVSQAYIDYLKARISENEELIIYCFKQDEQIKSPENIIIKRLPNDLLKTCALTKKK